MKKAILLTGLCLALCGCEAILIFKEPQHNHSGVYPTLGAKDGDTIYVDFNHNGRIDGPGEHVRLIGVKAPEAKGAPNSAGMRARDYVLSHLTAKVRIEMDAQVGQYDKDGYVLAHVYLLPNNAYFNDQCIKSHQIKKHKHKK